MSVAALYDIHGNVHALRAVLDEVDSMGIDHLVVGGDVLWGPLVSETLDALRRLEERATFIRGNADREVLEAGSGGGETDPNHAISEWCLDRVTERDREWVRSWPPTATLEVGGVGRVLFCHATPRSDEEIVTRITPEDEFAEPFSDVAEETIVCGHTHLQFKRDARGKTVVNSGSLGLPYQGRRGAFWTLLGPDVRHMRTDYDVDAATGAMRATDCPHVENMFCEPLLEPPSADEASAHLESLR